MKGQTSSIQQDKIRFSVYLYPYTSVITVYKGDYKAKKVVSTDETSNNEEKIFDLDKLKWELYKFRGVKIETIDKALFDVKWGAGSNYETNEFYISLYSEDKVFKSRKSYLHAKYRVYKYLKL